MTASSDCFRSNREIFKEVISNREWRQTFALEVREQFPAQIELLTTAERPSTDIENAIYNLMYESKQAGVRLVWIIPYTVEGDGIFKFDSTNSADQFDSGVFNRILHD